LKKFRVDGQDLRRDGDGEVTPRNPCASVSLKGSFYARSDLARLLPPIYPRGHRVNP
jgi:hypothetical protein